MAGHDAAGGPIALYRSARGLVRGTEPSIRRMLLEPQMPRTYLVGDRSGPLAERGELTAVGVRVRTVPDAGHHVMFDNAAAFAAVVGAQI